MIIYKATNKINGKVYVGQTVKTLESRWKRHCGKWGCGAISKAIKKYGSENFTVEKIDCAESKNGLNEKEKYWVDFYGCISPKGYNLKSGGDQVTFSEETKKKISDSHKGKKASLETKEKNRLNALGENNPFYGKKHKEESLLKMKQPRPHLRGRKRPDISLINSLKVGEKNPQFGKRYSEEEKKVFREKSLGVNNPRYGVTLSDELKEKISERVKCAMQRPEIKKRFREGLNRRKEAVNA